MTVELRITFANREIGCHQDVVGGYAQRGIAVLA